MSTDKENNKLEETKVTEKGQGDAKEDVKKVEANDIDNSAKEDKKDDIDVEEKESEKEKEKEKVAKPSRKPAAKAKETKKKEEKSDDEADEDDDDEAEDDKNDVSPAKSDKDGKGVPLLDQPLQQSGTRQRKTVERLNLKVDENAPIDIPEGNGVSLGSISVIEYNINKNKGDDLKKLHQLLFGRIAKPTFIKKNIRKFNGFDFDVKSDHYEKKKATIQKLDLKALKEVSSILNLAAVGSRDELSNALLDFLMEPIAPSGTASTKSPATTSLTKGGRPKRVAAARANDKGYSESEDEDDVKRTPRTRRLKGKRPNLKDESSSEDERDKKSDNDEKASDEDLSVEETPSSDESDTEKAKRKRVPAKPAPKVVPKKSAAKKPAPPPKKAEKKAAPPSKRKPESEEDSSEDDEPLVKKSKAPPTDEEIKTFVKGILEGANLEEITMKTVCKQVYAHYPDFDLAHKKDFIKSTVKSLIST